MTQDQYNAAVAFLKDKIAEADEIITVIEKQLKAVEIELTWYRESGDWNNYGEALNRLNNLLRRQQTWVRQKNLCNKALKQAENE